LRTASILAFQHLCEDLVQRKWFIILTITSICDITVEGTTSFLKENIIS
jgi:hypothetical protein